MNVIRASALGMCFGVRDALQRARGYPTPDRVAIHGQLVHNPVVLRDLEERGFSSIAESERDQDELPPRPAVLITAHGVSSSEQERMVQAGKEIIDTTCPLVRRAHRAACDLEAQGFLVLVIGRRGHVEVRGLVGDLAHAVVIESPSEVRRYPGDRLGIISQTTSTDRHVAAVRAEVARRNPGAEIRYVDTVCAPTRRRQGAVAELTSHADAIVVVGGRNSNNTRELVSRCREAGVPTFHVEGADDLQDEWLRGCSAVGLTAGTSTLDSTVDEVERALRALPGPGEQDAEAPRTQPHILVESSPRAEGSSEVVIG